MVPALITPIELPLRRNPFIVLIVIQLLFHAKTQRFRKAAKNLGVFCIYSLRLGEKFSYLTSNLKSQTSNNLDWLWIILGIILCVVGVIGSLLPLLPGPPIAYVGILLQLFRHPDPFDGKTYWIFAGVTVLTLVLDYLIPIWGTKKFGGTKYGAWGCTIGFIAAFWLGPLGIIIGPFVGAFVGELIGGQDAHKSFKSAVGSFVGFLVGSFMKIVVCFFMLYWIITTIHF